MMRGVFERCLEDSGRLIDEVLADSVLLAGLESAGQLVAECFRRRGRLFVCGNGGSMADAMHVAEEFSGRFRKDRQPYPAIAFSDPSHMSCVANDYGFEYVFSRQVEALGHAGDVLMVLSTSGNSANLIEAATSARGLGVRVVGFLGKGGGAVASLCDLPLVFPGRTSDRIQELHMLTLHALIEGVEKALGHE